MVALVACTSIEPGLSTASTTQPAPVMVRMEPFQFQQPWFSAVEPSTCSAVPVGTPVLDAPGWPPAGGGGAAVVVVVGLAVVVVTGAAVVVVVGLAVVVVTPGTVVVVDPVVVDPLVVVVVD